MIFKTIDLEVHEQYVIDFRRDSFKVSFNDISGFNKADYLNWLNVKIKEFPKGFVMIEEDGDLIGQLELSTREHKGRRIGYVHLYYLKPEHRQKGLGNEIHSYALQFFMEQKVKEYHLRVSPTNSQAIRFYEKIGMREVGAELKGKVIRMKGEVGE
jgi:RimJ/RimL family protein N-acetyltransferase